MKQEMASTLYQIWAIVRCSLPIYDLQDIFRLYHLWKNSRSLICLLNEETLSVSNHQEPIVKKCPVNAGYFFIKSKTLTESSSSFSQL
jgi:hypothetical protein